ncbi:bifunctional 2-keto-4-hydroxyglutarate aldolase/2-keto-3-deoxy-6-phosphogluconate aldolase [Sporosarcina sp. P17b]|uniref:bifunctional 2-keto-4-hydroxyglutarate aldolase/2-keto-3-deoxy-6-phosphogluconate aldolase n=1 Tax=Sporosarcina sp. P17b TaxID=2048260 RepID=UPI000C16B01B|nr:bifunctional 2-keto-4-hydroxyglutarate aldolase/2-keto-3-deoxy-6-phosphogluconate aldolase [Sporosarcina sp. P17b]PIC74673.1 bifunctional 2-keto-4-hydroxyglutarate aldolase/2-keto-3-deoxy-6-phosphogluconate aldolase [Sporosarcina sp. P17b]
MLPKHQVINHIMKQKVVAVIRAANAQEAIAISKSAISGGISVIELTFTTPFIEDAFKGLVDEDAVIGAGTVLDPETARIAILADAKFIVSPHYNEEIAKMCNRYAIPYLPGCMTITEMNKAMEGGCDILKLFPANQYKPSIISAFKGPLPHTHFMPTGGVSLDNISDWLQAGAVAVGIGSDLTKAYKAGGEEAVSKLAETYMEKVKEVK